MTSAPYFDHGFLCLCPGPFSHCMKSFTMISFSSAAALMVVSLTCLSAPILAQQPTSNPADGLNLKTPTYEGCFSSSEPLQDQGLYTYQALGWCQPLCVRMNKPVLAFSNGTNCWCGDELPAASNKVSDSECATPCNGFPANTCKFLNLRKTDE